MITIDVTWLPRKTNVQNAKHIQIQLWNERINNQMGHNSDQKQTTTKNYCVHKSEIK